MEDTFTTVNGQIVGWLAAVVEQNVVGFSTSQEQSFINGDFGSDNAYGAGAMGGSWAVEEGPAPAPEIDASCTAGALAQLLGGVAVLRGRRATDITDKTPTW